jgi:hypothetical protein
MAVSAAVGYFGVKHQPNMRPGIKLMWDYDCWPLWHFGDREVCNIDPDSLPLSAATRARLKDWAAIPDAKLDRSDPSSVTWTEEERQKFEAEGRDLWKLLQRELGDGYRVVYYSSTKHQVLMPENEHSA